MQCGHYVAASSSHQDWPNQGPISITLHKVKGTVESVKDHKVASFFLISSEDSTMPGPITLDDRVSRRKYERKKNYKIHSDHYSLRASQDGPTSTADLEFASNVRKAPWLATVFKRLAEKIYRRLSLDPFTFGTFVSLWGKTDHHGSAADFEPLEEVDELIICCRCYLPMPW